MADILSPTGIEAPVGGELHSRQMINRNYTRTNQIAIDSNKHAHGLVYQNLVTTSTGTVIDAIINNIASFTFRAGRRYRIEWDFSYHGTGNSDSLFYCSINSAAVIDPAAQLTGLTTLCGRTKGLITSYALGSHQHTGPIIAPYSPGGADTTLQIKFRAQRVTGDDGIILIGNGNEHVRYEIYDVGAQI
jgi:hypothetical protein